MKRAIETAEQRTARLERARQMRITNMARAAGVPEHQIARGDLDEQPLVDLSGELGKRMTMRPVLVNRGATAVGRWIAAGEIGFEEPQQRAIQWVQALWRRAEGGGSASTVYRLPTAEGDEGASQSYALAELAVLRRRVADSYWTVFENVCRWDLDPGGAPSDIIARDDDSRARAIVGFVAGKIAEWRGF